MLDTLIKEKWLTANGVIGFFPANVVGDDIEVYTDESRTEVLTTLHNLRQQGEHRDGIPNRSLGDYIAPKNTGLADYVGAFAVTAGLGSRNKIVEFKAANDDYSAILLESLADRLAEAFAERMHQRVRKEFWGFQPDEQLDNEALIGEKYVGIRPAPGYPACPEHTEKATLWELMDVQERTGIELTESMAMWPGAAVSGWYFSHPQSQYFVVGRMAQDQVADYAKRKGWTLKEAERWLGPNLGYNPRTDPEGLSRLGHLSGPLPNTTARPGSGCRWRPNRSRGRPRVGRCFLLPPVTRIVMIFTVLGAHDTIRGMRAVLFDMDGTLVDSEKLWDISLTALYEHHGGRLTPAGARLDGRRVGRGHHPHRLHRSGSGTRSGRNGGVRPLAARIHRRVVRRRAAVVPRRA